MTPHEQALWDEYCGDDELLRKLMEELGAWYFIYEAIAGDGK